MTISVFAVEDTSVQLSWTTLPGPEVTVEVGDSVEKLAATPMAWLHRRGRTPRPVRRLAGGTGGPGTLTVTGLDPGTTYDVCVHGPGVPRRRAATLTTLPPPPGRLLARVATISDLHIGEHRFGVFNTIEDRIPPPPGWDPPSLRCARAAIYEAAAWGADLVVAKGDLTRDSEPAEFREVAALLSSAPVPVVACLGNHDVRHRMDGAALLAGAAVTVAAGPTSYDLPGIRVVLGHTPHPRHRRGFVTDAQRRQLAGLVAGAERGALLLTHHQLQLHPWQRTYPPGVPPEQTRPLLDALAEANPATLVSGGHTHRCRAYRYGPLAVTQVGSTKDYPGVWAGYAVHEGGIRQVVRRISDPAALAWTEATTAALGGLWGPWAKGTLSGRCFSHSWPDRY